MQHRIGTVAKYHILNLIFSPKDIQLEFFAPKSKHVDSISVESFADN